MLIIVYDIMYRVAIKTTICVTYNTVTHFLQFTIYFLLLALKLLI